MSKIYNGALELVGNTPLVEVKNIEEELGLEARILVKLEYFNPAGSVKDRIAKAMIEDAEEKGLLKEGSVIIEPTSGNTGIGLASIAAVKGYRIILTMPETMSVERRNILKAYGAEIVLTEGAKGMKGAIEKADELAKEIPGSYIPGQFVNPANPEVHRKTTGPEIWKDTDGEVDLFIAGVGTGGTLTGVGEYLKSQNPDVKIVALEPASSPVLSTGKGGPHKIQGIGAGFVPDVLNTTVYDEIFTVENDDAFATGKLLAKKEADAKGAKEDAVIDAIVENAQMEIPDAMVETQQRQTIDEFGQRLQMQGLNLEQYFQFTGLTYEHMMEQVKPQAERRIKSRLVLEAVAAAENIEATEEDFDAEVKRMAEGYKMEADKIKELMGEAGKKQIMEDLAVRKAVDFVVSEAVEK